jgi:predicted PurR-regulated permease PerM
VANFIDDLPSRITEVQDFINRNFSTSLDFGDLINRIDKGKLAGSLASNTISFTTQLLGGLQVLTILLLTFYMVADGPPPAVICRRLRLTASNASSTRELAIDKTGGYLYSRALLALLSAVFHTAAFSVIGLRYGCARHLGRPCPSSFPSSAPTWPGCCRCSSPCWTTPSARSGC